MPFRAAHQAMLQGSWAFVCVYVRVVWKKGSNAPPWELITTRLAWHRGGGVLVTSAHRRPWEHFTYSVVAYMDGTAACLHCFHCWVRGDPHPVSAGPWGSHCLSHFILFFFYLQRVGTDVLSLQLIRLEITLNSGNLWRDKCSFLLTWSRVGLKPQCIPCCRWERDDDDDDDDDDRYIEFSVVFFHW